MSSYNNIEKRILSRKKEGNFIAIKGSIYQDIIKILKVYAADNQASKYMKQKLTEQKKATKYSSIVKDFKSSHSIIDGTCRQNNQQGH